MCSVLNGMSSGVICLGWKQKQSGGVCCSPHLTCCFVFLRACLYMCLFKQKNFVLPLVLIDEKCVKWPVTQIHSHCASQRQANGSNRKHTTGRTLLSSKQTVTTYTAHQERSPLHSSRLILLPNDGFYLPRPDTFYDPPALYVFSNALLSVLI